MYTNKNLRFHGIIGTYTRQTKIRKWAVVVIIIRWLDLLQPMQSVPITTKIVSSNSTQAGCI